VLSVLPLLAASAVLPAALLHFLGPEEVHFSAKAHFFPIAFSAGVAASASIALTLAGARRGDSRAVLVGTAFSSMAALLAVHGLSTPGILVGENEVISFTGAATLPVGGAVLALSVLPSIKRGQRVRGLLVLQAVLVALIAGLGTVALLEPSLVPAAPATGSTPAWILLVVGLSFYVVLAVRAARTFLLTRRRTDLLVVFGTVLLCVALPAALLIELAELGFWIGHGFELLGIGLVCVPVALDLRRGAQSRPLSGDLAGAEFVRAADEFLGPTVRALLVRLAEKDPYTEAHTRAVALRAVQVGEELGLAPSRLRELAIGAIVHDVGKLSVPDAILQKPGSLDDEEFAVIKEHPRRGVELLEELGGFSPVVLGLVLDHHERLDGSGYPRGLRAEDLSLETRVLGACDVFDALVSERVYREAWTVERALALLREGSGTAFDPRCVAAIERIELGASEELSFKRRAQPLPSDVGSPASA
jgi:HD-GYP domain-containing protein (c-di-GMP phosphodiesterase class II)